MIIRRIVAFFDASNLPYLTMIKLILTKNSEKEKDLTAKEKRMISEKPFMYTRCVVYTL